MFFPNLSLRAFLRNIKSPLFSAKFSLLAFFSFHQYLNYRCSPYYCSENHHHHHDHHHNPHQTLDFKRYLAEKNMQRLSDLEIANRPYIAFYYDGIRKSLDCFEKYEVYANPKAVERYRKKEPLLPEEKQELGIICLIFKANEITQGHRNISHGGLMATVMDHFMGRLSEMVADGSNVATANLNLNYRKPVHVGKEYLLEVHFEKMEKDRKIFLKGRILNEKNEVCIDANSLFLKVNWDKHHPK